MKIRKSLLVSAVSLLTFTLVGCGETTPTKQPTEKPTQQDPTIVDPTIVDPTIPGGDPTQQEPTVVDPTPVDPTIVDPTPTDPQPTVQTGPFITEPTTISFQTTAGKANQVYLNDFIADFQQVEPNVTVILDIVSGSYSDIANQITSGFAIGEYGDLAMVYPDAVADFIDYGKAFDVSPYMTNKDYGWSDEDMEDLVETFLDEGRNYTVKGVYSLPFSKSTELVYYNREKVLGLTLDGVNSGNPITENYLERLTWEEFFDVLCPAIVAYTNTEKGKNLIDKTGKDWAIMGYDSDDNLFITLAAAYGIPYTSIKNGEGSVDFVNADMKALVKKFNGYSKNHYILSQGGTGSRANTFFTADQALFSVGSTAGAQYNYSTSNPMDVGVFKLPKPAGKQTKTILQGPSVAFLTHPNSQGKVDQNRKLASWLFYKFMVNKENSLAWAIGANYMPVRLSGYESEDYLETYDVANCPEKTLDLLTARIANYVPDITDTYFTSPAFKGSNECRNQVGALMGKALTSTNDATDTNLDQWFKDAYDACIKAMRS